MNKYKGILLGYVVAFIMGYGYGIIDALSEFDKVQVGVSVGVIIIVLIVILFFGPKDALVSNDEVKE